MDVCVRSIKITEGFVQTAIDGLKDVPIMTPRLLLRPCDGEPEFKWHIEPGSTGGCTVQLHSRKIMDRMAAALNEIQNPVETALAAGDAESDARFQPETQQARNVREIETPKAMIVWDIEKDGVGTSFLHSSSRL